MALTASAKNGKEYPPCPAGTHIGRCVQVIDLGTQWSDKFEKSAHKVRLAWEVPNERFVFDDTKGEEPYILGREFSLSLAEKSALRPLLESWRGRAFNQKELDGFDISKLLGVPCMLSLSHVQKDGKTYAQVAGVSAMMKGVTIPDQITPSISYQVEDGRNETFKKLPEWLQKKVAECDEFKVRTGRPAPEPESPSDPQPGDDQMPF